MVRLRLPFVIALASLMPAAAAAQHDAGHHHDASEQLGRVNFPVSCNRAAQDLFNRGAAWLHSFEYIEAEHVFAQAAEADPRCAMAHWGVAMSQYHPLWSPPTPAELERGNQAIARARLLGAATPREGAYIAALEGFYRDADRVDHRARSLAYTDAMEQVHRQHPDDNEAAVFFALALVAAGTTDDDRTFSRERRAGEILNAVLAREPDHPGVTHYLIHSFDYPQLADLALDAARRYAGIAPASAHAQHMPSHIFTRLGLWQDSIRSNLAAEASARAYAARNNMAGAWDEQLHAMDYLTYAYLQAGQDGDARQVLDRLNAFERVDPVNFKVAYAYSAIPARYVLERRRWDEAATLALSPNAMRVVPWAQFRWGEAPIHFARAVGAARSGNPVLARTEVASLQSIRQGLASPQGYDWGVQVDILRQIAAAWLAQAEGRSDEALQMMRAAADLDDRTEKHPVTPGAILPAREQLGELLLEMNRPAEALAEFDAALSRAPRRLNGLYGGARAAQLAGNATRAAELYATIAELGSGSDGARPALAEARAFLAASARR